MSKQEISSFDIEELAKHLCGLDENEEYGIVETILYEKYNIDFDNFHKLIGQLLPLIDVGKGVSGTCYKGFGSGHTWFVKIKI